MDHNLKSRTGRNETDFADQPAEHAARDGGIQSRDPVALALNDGESMTADIVGRIQVTLKDIDTIPVQLQNDIVVDADDGTEYISTYKLNREYDFVEVVRPTTLVDMHLSDIGTRHFFCFPDNISAFIAMFTHLTVPQLTSIAVVHGIRLPKNIRKPQVQLALLKHSCPGSCPGRLPLLFTPCGRRRGADKVKQLDGEVIEMEIAQSKLSIKNRSAAIKSNMPSQKIETHLNSKKDGQARADKRNTEIRRNTLKTAVESANSNFPHFATASDRNDIIVDWQTAMDPAAWMPYPCAVCAQTVRKKNILLQDPADINLRLLRNEHLPAKCLPSTYNLAAYNDAILYHQALTVKDKLGPMYVCSMCFNNLQKHKQPVNAIANFQYYARDELPDDVKLAFQHASMFDLMLISRSRSTRISYLYSNNADSTEYEKPKAKSQRYTKGNVAIFAQDIPTVRNVLPPDISDIQEAMCALFIGADTIPSKENIKKLSPVLVCKNRVAKLIDFLLKENSWYVEAGIEFSPKNFEALFDKSDSNEDIAVLKGVELRCLPDGNDMSASSYAVTGDVEDHEDQVVLENDANRACIVMEAVGYTLADHSPIDYEEMKKSALAWCLDKKQYIQMRSGSKFMSDTDPGLLTYNFPSLDPWGIGSFHEPLRTKTQRISFEHQVTNLLRHHDGAFQANPNFAYVCWNIMQKKEVNKHASFRTDASTQSAVVKDVYDMAPHLSSLLAKWEANKNAKPSTKQEKKAMKTLSKLKLIAKDLRGSSGYKQCRRNEIRAMIKKMSTPALFMTINPGDVSDPLLAAMAGLTQENWLKMTSFERSVFVARHPGVAAEYFDAVITAFIEKILRYDPDSTDIGLFGRCKGYYGTVEAQGRGTLHCHILVWLEGNPSPQALRDRMVADDGFKSTMFRWLESIIRCELPSTTEVVVEDHGIATRMPKRAAGKVDPRCTKGPIKSPEMTDDEFATAFRETVEELACVCNWHVHKPTCWKHLKPGETQSDAQCRMRINGKTRALTELDPETDSILLRRLHPRINNFNDVVLFLLRCNMDIKYIGSGTAAKALCYYVTDYITKANLSVHVGLSAVEYAIKSNEDKFKKSPADTDKIQRSLFTKSIMAMMSKQELSHQQVMSYLIGGGDCYRSHTFKTVKWGEIDRHISTLEKKRKNQDGPIYDDQVMQVDDDGHGAEDNDMRPCQDSRTTMIHDRADHEMLDAGNDKERTLDKEDDQDDHHSDDDEQGPAADQVTLFLKDGYIGVASPIFDYPLRSSDEAFNELCLWEYEEWVVKISQKAENARTDKMQDKDDGAADAATALDPEPLFLPDFDDEDVQEEVVLSPTTNRKRRGRLATARGLFSKGHRQIETHMSRLRVTPVVIVLLGPVIPRPDRDEPERLRWCRAMLMLFKPWRVLSDLIGENQSWQEAFDATTFSSSSLEIMSNLNVENECKDARDEYSKLRREGKVRNLLEGADTDVNYSPGDSDSLGTALLNDPYLDADDEDVGADEDNYAHRHGGPDKTTDSKESFEKEIVMNLNRSGLWTSRNITGSGRDDSHATLTEELDIENIAIQSTLMKELGKNKRPAQGAPQSDDAPRNKRRRKKLDLNSGEDKEPSSSLNGLPEMDINILDSAEVVLHEIGSRNIALETPFQTLDRLINRTTSDGKRIAGNVEQERALRMIAEHFITGTEEQLLLYIAGVAGSGKSFIVHTLVEFFECCGVSDRLLLSAPTGCAAVLIDGYTIHALTFLPKSRHNRFNIDDLRKIWHNIRYLVIDEISMISAQFLCEISARLNQGKAPENIGSDTVFGGINVIFLGDMGQLKPVQAASVFSHTLTDKLIPNTTQTVDGQAALYGAFIWRLVTKVVILRKNWRSATDPDYSNLLARVRSGLAWDGLRPLSGEQVGDGHNYAQSDFNTLRSRRLQILDPAEAALFVDAPIIVGTKLVRDLINRERVKDFAATQNSKMHYYYSKDRFRRVAAEGTTQERLWNVRSAVSKDSLGMLPLVGGMKVMITENIAIKYHVVNGAEGTVTDIKYTLDSNGKRYASCVYVHLPGSNVQSYGLGKDVVPIVPVCTSFQYTSPNGGKFTITRSQLPLLPAYAYTDYKSQGRSLVRVIVDLAGCRGLQSLYVMISRATSLNSLAIFRNFSSNKVNVRLSEDFRNEFARLEALDAQTTLQWDIRHSQEIIEAEQY